jgi:hypothetical protein
MFARQRREGRGRQRLAELEALHLRAAALAQELALLEGLRLRPPPSDAACGTDDDRFGDGGVVGVAGQAADKQRSIFNASTGKRFSCASDE